MTKQTKSFVSLFTLVAFLFTQTGIPASAFAAAVTEVKLPPAGFQISIPAEIGTVENLKTGTGPTLIHIQTAHGNYEAQKNIEAILEYLKANYGIKTLFVEGGASQLYAGDFRVAVHRALEVELGTP